MNMDYKVFESIVRETVADYTNRMAMADVVSPEFDECYRDHEIMDWNDPQDGKDYEARGWGLKAE